ncbi:MAG: DUF3672 domain-containing protein [Treponema sp.]|jgi:hypothetical protein|nr:DUF3672 domain-containing protein [Treponema sp.]
MVKNKGGFLGTIKAESGYLNNVEIEEQATFKGRVFSDDLIVDYDPNSMQRFPASGSYAVNTRPYTIQQAVNSFLGKNSVAQGTYLVDDGEIAGKKIRSIGFVGDTAAQGGDVILEIYTTDSTRYYWINGLVVIAFWFQLGTGTKKVRFVNLPNSAGAAASGTLYRELGNDGNHYLKIKA